MVPSRNSPRVFSFPNFYTGLNERGFNTGKHIAFQRLPQYDNSGEVVISSSRGLDRSETAMVKILIGGVVAGVVIFFWGFVSHMLLPLGEMGLKTIAHEDDLNAAIKKDVRESGLYFIPGRDMSQSPSQEVMEAHMAKIAQGPYAFMVVYPNGRDASLAKRLPVEFGTNVGSAFLAAIIVSQLRPGFLVRVACVTIVGILASVITLVPYWNWYGFPTDFTLAQIAENTVGWFLAGLALAAMVRVPPATKDRANELAGSQ
jgi:hypothetical protein